MRGIRFRLSLRLLVWRLTFNFQTLGELLGLYLSFMGFLSQLHGSGLRSLARGLMLSHLKSLEGL